MATSWYVATLFPVFSAVFAIAACGGDSESTIAVPDGGTRPTDGAKGICCPVSSGVASAYAGGYTEDPSTCGQLFDGLCNPRIVTGDHGCPTFAYDGCPARSFDAGAD